MHAYSMYANGFQSCLNDRELAIDEFDSISWRLERLHSKSSSSDRFQMRKLGFVFADSMFRMRVGKAAPE